MWNRKYTKQKYSAQRVNHSGFSFASKLEASVFDLLKLMEKAGEIEFLRAQVNVYLSRAEINYRPDFLIRDLKKNGQETYVEAKGFETPEWRIKLKLWRFYGPGPLWIFKGSHVNPRLTEVVEPKGSEEKE